MAIGEFASAGQSISMCGDIKDETLLLHAAAFNETKLPTSNDDGRNNEVFAPCWYFLLKAALLSFNSVSVMLLKPMLSQSEMLAADDHRLAANLSTRQTILFSTRIWEDWIITTSTDDRAKLQRSVKFRLAVSCALLITTFHRVSAGTIPAN